MGLPLFSQRYQTPDVRVEPEPTPACEKWTHWNAFDPDSDEFFESEDAVYEAFIDPSQLPLRDSEDGEQSRSSSLPPVVMRYAESSSSSSSSGRGTPTDDTQTVSVEEVNLDTRQSGWVQVGRIDEGETRRDPMPPTFVESPIEDRVYQAGEMVTQYANMYQIVATPPRRPAPSQTPPHITAPPYIRSPTYIDYASRPPTPPMHIERASRPTTPVRNNGSERGAPPSSPVTPLRPATPPREEEPTPPPSVTPRIYSWGGSPWIVPSPVPASPLAHRGVPPPMTWVAPITVIPPSRVRG